MTGTVKPTGLRSIKEVWKEYSTWAFAVILAGPELYHMASTFGMLNDAAMPTEILTPIRIVAGIGLVAKFVKQKKPEVK